MPNKSFEKKNICFLVWRSGELFSFISITQQVCCQVTFDKSSFFSNPASLRKSDTPRLIGCIAQHFPGFISLYRCVVLHSLDHDPTYPGFPLSTLHSVGGRLALCLCLYFTETVSIRPVICLNCFANTYYTFVNAFWVHMTWKRVFWWFL